MCVFNTLVSGLATFYVGSELCVGLYQYSTYCKSNYSILMWGGIRVLISSGSLSIYKSL